MPKVPKAVSLRAVLEKFSPESGWHYISVSTATADRFSFEKGNRRVVCTLNDSERFQCALMPYDGSFFIMINKRIRKKLGIEPGDHVRVILEKDESRYGLPMPEEFQEILDQDPEGDKLFHQLTPGKQRSILYQVGKPSDIDRRIHIGLVFVEHLKKNNGKLIYDQLAQELKRPSF